MGNNKIRIITAQGPTQVLNVIALLKYEFINKNDQFYEYDDCLVLGGFYIEESDKNFDFFLNTCIEIASHWNFKSVIYLSDNDLEIGKLSFFGTVQSVKKKLSLNLVEKIYVCRNWQRFNEILLECYQNAFKIAYGDGFGSFDIRGDFDILRSLNPNGYSKINKAYLFIPIEEGNNSFSLVSDIVQIPIDFLTNTINEVAFDMDDLKTYTKSIKINSCDKLTLITLSNFSEASMVKPMITHKWMSTILYFIKKLLFLRINVVLKFVNFLEKLLKTNMAEQEALMYFSQVLRYANKNELLIVKSHPRENFSQSLRLLRLLTRKGYNSILINQRFSNTPIEFFFKYLTFDKIISFSSSSSLTAKLILDIDDSRIIPFIDQDIRKKYFRKNFANNCKYQKLWLELLKQAEVKSFSPLRISDY